VQGDEGMEVYGVFEPGSTMVDFCVVIGGDGTLLHLNELFQESKSVPPVVPLAIMGSLGFLLPYPFHTYKNFLKSVMDPVPSNVLFRTRLLCQVYNPDISEKEPQYTYQVLNELLVSRGTSPYLTKLEFYVDEELATYIHADGVIISSPTGSTAYSLSAGGTMMPPQVPAILVTPICPHTLSFRPLVLPDSSRLKIRIPKDARAGVVASFDGRNSRNLEKEHYIEVTMSPWPLPTFTIRSPILEWFKSIESRLNWNVREIQKPLANDDLKRDKSKPTTKEPPVTTVNKDVPDGKQKEQQNKV